MESEEGEGKRDEEDDEIEGVREVVYNPLLRNFCRVAEY